MRTAQRLPFGWCVGLALGLELGLVARVEARPRGNLPSGFTMKRTYQASKVRRARTHGFLVRMKSRGGRAVINARRAKGRKRLAV